VSRVLLVTIILIGRTGTEVVTCETARGLRQRNHDVSIYTQQEGPTAEQLRAEGFQVVTDIASLSTPPDVIQANQTYPLLEIVGRFPRVPVISICHDSTVWYNEPIDLPMIRRHVAVDLACRDRIASALPDLGQEIELLHNAVDLARFRQRGLLPATPQRALIITKNARDLDAIVAACTQRGIDVDVLGPAVDNEVDDLAERLAGYDLVFATARSAHEALAAGCAVIVVDGRGLAGLVTRDVVASWRDNNFGLRLLTRAISAEAIAAEIDRYDPNDARSVSDFVRTNSPLERYLDRLEAIHREVIAEGAAVCGGDDILPYRLALAARALVSAQIRQNELDWASAAREWDQQVRAEFHACMLAREAELEARAQAEKAELQAREAALRAAQAETFKARAREREAAFQAEFNAYRDWVAPRNLPWRIMRKIRRMVSGSSD
jgi:hypothetical protein